LSAEAIVWGPYPSYDDVARFEYGRRFWRLPEMRRRLLAHWLDERHPHRERFLEQRELLESMLGSEESVPALDARLRQGGASLRCVAREIASMPRPFPIRSSALINHRNGCQWLGDCRRMADSINVTILTALH